MIINEKARALVERLRKDYDLGMRIIELSDLDDAADLIESLLTERDRLTAQVEAWFAEHEREHERAGRLKAECDALKRRLDIVREVYAGIEGFLPQTAPEGYCLRIIEQMAHAAMGGER